MKKNEEFDYIFEVASEDREKAINVRVATNGLKIDALNRLVGYMDAMKGGIEEILAE